MKESQWRVAARKAIQKAIADSAGKDDKDIRRAIKEAYPFGERARYPYKIWLDEVKALTGNRTVQYRQRRKKPQSTDPNQGMLI
jgi:hypothetical protein